NRALDAFPLALGAHARGRHLHALRTLAVLHAGHATEIAPRGIRAAFAWTVMVRARAHDDRPPVIRPVVAVVRIARAVVAARPVAVARVGARIAVANAAVEAAVAAVTEATIRGAVVARTRTAARVVNT